jgi:RNA polymerase sigma factor (sigma-70 family)
MATAQPDTLMRYIKELAGGRTGHRTDRQLLDDFAVHGDEQAFAGLVDRHGPLVLRVCRRVLRHEQDAEDAFQATFLVLARHHGSIRRRDSLASWLHGVAYRTAMKAKRSAARRRNHEARLRDRTPPAAPRQTWDDIQVVLDAEIQCLPELFRSAFVLCVLDGKTVPAAANELGVKEGTVSWRLARARQRLRQRLVRRGIQLSSVLAALSLVHEAGRAAVPPALAAPTVRFGLLVAAGKPAAGVIPTHIAALAAGVTRAMFLTKARIAVAMLFAMSFFAAGAAGLAHELFAATPQSPADPLSHTANQALQSAPAPETAKLHPAEEKDSITYYGRVLAPDGQPLAEARLVLLGKSKKITLGKSEFDGRFAVRVPKGSIAGHFLVAQANGFGLDFVHLDGLNSVRPLDLRLVKDHVIRGRVVDTQGKPVAGVGVSVARIDAFDSNSVDSFLAEWINRMVSWAWPEGNKILFQVTDFITVKTDADGRFVLAGTGAERVVGLYVGGAGIAETGLRVINRSGFDPRSYNERTRQNAPIIISGDQHSPAPQLHGPEPTIVVEPGKTIRGLVHDAHTNKSWPWVEIVVGHYYLNPGRMLTTRTDAAGHYEIRGVPKASDYMLLVQPDLAAGLPGRQVHVPDTNGYEPIRANIAVTKLQQTTVVTGRLIDSATGKGIRGTVHVGLLPDNPLPRAHPDYPETVSVDTAEDGAFRIVTVPGPVLLSGGVEHEPMSGGQLVRSFKYKPARPDARYPQYFPPDQPGTYRAVSGRLVPIQGNFCKVLSIEPGTAAVKQDILIEPASAITVNIKDGKGRPLTGVFVLEKGRTYLLGQPLRSETDHWLVSGVAESGQPRRLVFYEPSKKLFATVLIKGDEKGPVEVQLQPCGSIEGRIVDRDGKPQKDVNVNVTYLDGLGGDFLAMHVFIHASRPVATDDKGAFFIDALIPGIPFQLNRRPTRHRGWQLFVERISVESGRTRDLGDVRLPAEH